MILFKKKHPIRLELADFRFLCIHCLQAFGDISKWTVVLGSSASQGPQIKDVSFIIEAVGHQVDCDSPQTKKKVGTPSVLFM